MSQYRVIKSALQGSITLPASKSQTLRAILFASLGRGKSKIHSYLASSDTYAMIEACRLLGAKIDASSSSLEIEGIDGVVNYTEDVINAYNSGIVLRFLSAAGSLAQNPVVITGDNSCRHQRPMQPLLEALTQLGVKAVAMRADGFAPVIIQGPLQPGSAKICGQDSQHVSAVLIAAAFAKGPIDLYVANAGEKPWVALTLHWFDRLGIPYENNNFSHYRMKGNSRYQGFEYRVPGDLSSAAFPIAAALITGSQIVLENIDMREPQGDKELFYLFQKMGADIEIDEKNKRVEVKKGKRLKGARVDINSFIDAITILAVVACFAEGETHIYNGAVAQQKECNRLECIAKELRKMGATIEATHDGLLIAKSALQGAQVYSHNDHRMAMSLAVAGLGACGVTSIESVECIGKTFPSFLSDFKALGATIEQVL